MLLRRACLLALSTVLLVLTSCGDVEVHDARTIRPPTVESAPPAPTTTVAPDERRALRAISVVLGRLFPTTTTTTVPAPPVTAPAPPRIVTYPASYQPCDGEYPPCWRVATESGGDYNAYNPGGCDGRGCFGKWQFSGEWACKLGLPCDLRTATPAQQDEAARLLWNGGAGCRNWAAC